MRLDRIAQRTGDDMPLGIARDSGDVRIEADRDARLATLDLGIDDLRALDPDQAVVERLARLAPLLAWKSGPFPLRATKPARMTNSPNRSPGWRSAA